MVWYEERSMELHFSVLGKVKTNSDKDDWVQKAVAKTGVTGVVAKMKLAKDARDFFDAFQAQTTTKNFAAWCKEKYAPKPTVAVAKPAYKPKKLKETPAPAVAVQDLPVFSQHAIKAEIEVGHKGLPKKRIKLRYHLLPNDHATKAELEKAATKRTLKWVRRVYAQANLAPKILGIDEITAVPDNAIAVAGVLTPGYKQPKLPAGGSKISIELTDNAKSTETVDVALTKDQSTKAIADAIALALRGKSYTVTGPTEHLSDDTHYTSHDLVVTKAGHPVSIKISHDDSQLDRDVLQVPTLSKGMDAEDGLYGGTPVQRHMLRQGASDDDQVDIYVLEKGGINGRAYPKYTEITGKKSPPAPYRNAAYVVFANTAPKVKGIVFDDQLEVSPFTLPHEIGHVVADTGHTEAEGDVMHGGWSQDNALKANKRIYSKPLLVGSIHLKTEVDRDKQDVCAEMRTRGNKKILDPW